MLSPRPSALGIDAVNDANLDSVVPFSAAREFSVALPRSAAWQGESTSWRGILRQRLEHEKMQRPGGGLRWDDRRPSATSNFEPNDWCGVLDSNQ